MAVSERIQEALVKIKKSDFDNALIQTCIAIDATSKKMFPKDSNSNRFKKYFKKKRAFIWWQILNGVPDAKSELLLSFSDKGYVSIETIMYKYVRCNLLHEGEMHEKIIFQNVGYFKVNSDSSIVLPLAYLEALIASIISSNVNKNEKMENDFYVYYGNYLANLNDYWGDENKMREAIRNGFLYNVEEMINRKKNQ